MHVLQNFVFILESLFVPWFEKNFEHRLKKLQNRETKKLNRGSGTQQNLAYSI